MNALRCLIAFAVMGLIGSAQAESTIPRAAQHYRNDLVRNARLAWGLNAPVATLAGQVHQESAWNPQARSSYANGLAQFTPDTAVWICGAYPALKSSNAGMPDACNAFNPAWALRALAIYDKHLWDRVQARTPCDRMAMTLSAYNGGLGWVKKDIKLASAQGADKLAWWNQVAHYNAGRALWAFKENRGYPARILQRWEPLYVRAGWGTGVCM